MYAIIQKTEEKLIKSDKFVLSFKKRFNRSCNDTEMETEQDITKGKGLKKGRKIGQLSTKGGLSIYLTRFSGCQEIRRIAISLSEKSCQP